MAESKYSLGEVIAALDGKPEGKEWIADCPAKPGVDHKFRIWRGNGAQGWALKCWHGCNKNDVYAAAQKKLDARGPRPETTQPPPAKKAKTSAEWGWPGQWHPLTEETLTTIVWSRPDSYTPDLETLLAFGFREKQDRTGRTMFAYPIAVPDDLSSLGLLKIGYADILETDKSFPRRMWFQASPSGVCPKDLLFGAEIPFRPRVEGAKHRDLIARIQSGAFKPISARLRKLAREIFFVEGQWDAMCLAELGFTAVATLSSAQRTLSPEILKWLHGADHVYLLPDNDPKDSAGEKAMQALQPICAAAAPSRIIRFPGAIKDACAFVKEKGFDYVRKAIRDEIEISKATPPSDPLWKPNAKGEMLCVRSADQYEMKLQKWLWDGRLGEAVLNLFVGNADVGKSTVVSSLCACATTGRRWPLSQDQHPPFDVLMAVREEDKQRTVIPRLVAAGGDRSRLKFILKVNIPGDGSAPREERRFALDQDIELVENFLVAHPGVRLVVFDPLTSYLGKLKKNADDDIRFVLEKLSELAQKTNVTVLALNHFNKNTDKEALYRTSGSQEWINVPRIVWGFAKDDDEIADQRIMANLKGNTTSSKKKVSVNYTFKGVPVPMEEGVADIGCVVWVGETQTTMETALKPRDQKNTEQVASWLKTYLSSGSKRSREILSEAGKLGYTKKMIWNAKESLNAESKQLSDGHYMRLPGHEWPNKKREETTNVSFDES